MEVRAEASPRLRQLGVGHYEAVTRDGRQYLVLYDHDGKLLAGAERRTSGPRHVVHVEQPGDAYTFIWNQSTGVFKLVTSRGTFALEIGKDPSGRARAAYDERAIPIRAIVTALDEATLPAAPFDLQAVLEKSNDRPVYCQGPDKTGYAVSNHAIVSPLHGAVNAWLGVSYNSPSVAIVPAFTGSQLCEAARQRANQQCWNGDCTGCCSFDECATLCIDVWNNEGFLCAAASIMGWSCSQAPPQPGGGGEGGEPGPFHQSPDPPTGPSSSGLGNCCGWVNQSDCSGGSNGCTVHWVCTSYNC
jgi:hypothetical protein